MLVPRRGKSLLLCIGNVILGKAPACSSGSTACRLSALPALIAVVNDELVCFKSARTFSGPLTKSRLYIKLKHCCIHCIHALYVNIYNLAMFAIFAMKILLNLDSRRFVLETIAPNKSSSRKKTLPGTSMQCKISVAFMSPISWAENNMPFSVFHNHHPCQPQVA